MKSLLPAIAEDHRPRVRKIRSGTRTSLLMMAVAALGLCALFFFVRREPSVSPILVKVAFSGFFLSLVNGVAVLGYAFGCEQRSKRKRRLEEIGDEVGVAVQRLSDGPDAFRITGLVRAQVGILLLSAIVGSVAIGMVLRSGR